MKLLLPLLLFAGPALPTLGQVAPPFTDSNLPLVVIDTQGSTIVDDPKVAAQMRIIDRGPGQRNALTDVPNQYKGRIGIELRGSSSQSMPKKSYGLETLDRDGEELDTTLLGMPAEHDWVLTANYADKTLLRNSLTYELASQLGQYASRSRYCELFLNGEYKGVYVLGEKIKRGSNRVNISKLKSTDVRGDAVTGGYLLKLDKLTGTPAGGFYSRQADPDFPTNAAPYIQVEYPKLKDLVPAQLNYIAAYIDSFEVALAGPNFTDPAVGYRRYLDVPSFIDYFLLTELSRNVDSFYSSTFFYKDRSSKGGKLVMGPVWDFDLAWHNANYNDSHLTEGWQYTQTGPFWRRRLLQDPAFTEALYSRWTVLRSAQLSEEHLYHMIDSSATQLNESQERNFQAWPIMGQYVWPNPEPIATSYAGEISNIKQWVHDRLLWMDNNLPGRPNGSITSTQAQRTTELELVAFPSPFSDNLTIRYEQRVAGAVSLELLSTLGRVVSRQQLTNQAAGSQTSTISNVADLPAGLYFLRLTSPAGSQTLRVQKLAI
ncbi:CotH kinase family protein [Hymenobacter mucosus]|uniref:Por secretion system C-terminal sorting domain-containing protein n=1 Tax=Hymenobacter mucosus TaxID=1411120 RepID=A0A238VXT1_9BACT|nr:CotH kinase family protein [Hymenobacter mucosus]SNR38957.1 Por secretion system C-terminal sorting domain-containing protein [Hymenobacter mucosus]